MSHATMPPTLRTTTWSRWSATIPDGTLIHLTQLPWDRHSHVTWPLFNYPPCSVFSKKRKQANSFIYEKLVKQNLWLAISFCFSFWYWELEGQLKYTFTTITLRSKTRVGNSVNQSKWTDNPQPWLLVLPSGTGVTPSSATLPTTGKCRVKLLKLLD